MTCFNVNCVNCSLSGRREDKNMPSCLVLLLLLPRREEVVTEDLTNLLLILIFANHTTCIARLHDLYPPLSDYSYNLDYL